MKRKQPTLTTKLASALLALGEIPHEHAKQMTDEQICSLYHFDHDPIRHADGGPTVGWNLTPRLIVPHRVKSATVDMPAMAKDRRVTDKWNEFTARMAAKGSGQPRKKGKMQSRPFPKRKKT